MTRRQDELSHTIDLIINVTLGVALLLGGCVAIVAVIAAVNGIVSLVGHLT
jgi:hypothetical protein